MFFPVAGDPYYSLVSLLFPMTGTNNGTTFTDVSPSPKTVTVSGNTKTVTATSKWGNSSSYFDGTGDYLTVPTLISATEDFCIEGWFYIPSTASNKCLFSQRSATTQSGRMVITYVPSGAVGTINGFINASSNVNADVANATQDTWFHYALNRSGNVFTAYLNGVAGTPITQSGVSVEQVTFTIGRNPAATANDYLGYIQDFRVTPYARYTDNFVVPSGPLAVRLPDTKCRVKSESSYSTIARLGL